MKRTVVHIDRLILRNIDQVDASAVSKSLESELQRLLASPQYRVQATSNSQISHLKTQTIRQGAKASPARLGSDAAQSVAKVIHSWTK